MSDDEGQLRIDDGQEGDGSCGGGSMPNTRVDNKLAVTDSNRTAENNNLCNLTANSTPPLLEDEDSSIEEGEILEQTV